jgi:cyanophycinase-like exopeptidase
MSPTAAAEKGIAVAATAAGAAVTGGFVVTDARLIALGAGVRGLTALKR